MAVILEYAKPELQSHWKLIRHGANTLLILLGLWAAVFLGPLYIFIVGAMAAGLLVRAIHRWRSALVLGAVALIFSPLSLQAGRATIDYFRGTATLHGRGLMRGTSRVDPGTRLQYSSGGCMVYGNEWLTDSPYNAALYLWVSTLGPMKGCYAGPYPDEATARAALAGAKVFDLRQLPTDSIMVDGVTVKLRAGLGNEILKGFREGPATDAADSKLLKAYGEAHAMLYKGSCVTIGVPAEIMPAGDPNAVILIDCATGKLFSYYVDNGMGFYFRRAWR
jgi:hypothetical protein